MSATDTCCDGPYPPLPEAWVRLRYFFGKRLGVADLRDEQSYHRSKRRFHNRHLHGAGVVCGLAVSRFDPEDPDDTVIRVKRGAALDTCGNEIVVGWDQCIDLAAWFSRRLAEETRAGRPFPPESGLDDEGRMRVCVALRYRECATNPEAAPRDPCACDTGGCEYGRVQEGFELTLLLPDEAEPYEERTVFPGAETLSDALAGADDAPDLLDALAEAIGGGCPEGRDPDWVLLGCLTAVLNEDGDEVVGFGPDDTWSGPPAVLLSTAALQELLLALSAEDGAAVVPTALELLPVSGPGRLLALRVPVELVEGTRNADRVQLRRLTGAGAWVEPNNLSLEWEDAAGGPTLLIRGRPRNFFRDGGRYRLAVEEGAEPIIDADLHPLRYTGSFRLDDVGGDLQLTHLPT